MNEEILGLLGVSPEQMQEYQQRQSLAGLQALGTALMQAGAPRQGGRVSTLVGLGQAAPAFAQGRAQEMDTILKSLLQRRQVEQLAAEQQARQRQQTALEGLRTRMQPVTPQTALGMPGRVGPTPERAGMVGQTPQFGREDALRAAMNPDLPAPEREMLFKYAEATKPQESKLPSDVQEYQFAVSQGYQGTLLDYQRDLRKSGATQITNVVGGTKKLQEELGKGGSAILENSYNQAVAANETLSVIEDIRPMLSDGVFAGPLSQAPRLIAQVATSLGVTGKDTQETLKRTAATMQGLAKFELNAAAAMRGQGAITENERMLIQRAAGGRLDQFTVPEVLELLGAMEKTANFRIAQHGKNLDKVRATAKGDPNAEAIINLYTVDRASPAIAPQATPSAPRRFNPATGRVE